jgi:acyl-CoA thioester hydrolase
MEIRIYYEDTDGEGYVYYGNYLRYFERARTEYLRQQNIEVAEFVSQRILFVVSEVHIKYHSPAYYNDILVINTKISELKGARLTFSHTIREKLTNRLVVSGSAELACVKGGKPRRIPEKVISCLKS